MPSERQDHPMDCGGVPLEALYEVSWCGCNQKPHYLLEQERDHAKSCPSVAFFTISWSSQPSCWNGTQISDSRLASDLCPGNELFTSSALCSWHNIARAMTVKWPHSSSNWQVFKESHPTVVWFLLFALFLPLGLVWRLTRVASVHAW